MFLICLLITFIVAFNFGLLTGCLLSSRRMEKVAIQKASLSSELRDLKSPAAEKTRRYEGGESQEFLLQQARSTPLA